VRHKAVVFAPEQPVKARGCVPPCYSVGITRLFAAPRSRGSTAPDGLRKALGYRSPCEFRKQLEERTTGGAVGAGHRPNGNSNLLMEASAMSFGCGLSKGVVSDKRSDVARQST
jgi:hypothetical protein